MVIGFWRRRGGGLHAGDVKAEEGGNRGLAGSLASGDFDGIAGVGFSIDEGVAGGTGEGVDSAGERRGYFLKVLGSLKAPFFFRAIEEAHFDKTGGGGGIVEVGTKNAERLRLDASGAEGAVTVSEPGHREESVLHGEAEAGGLARVVEVDKGFGSLGVVACGAVEVDGDEGVCPELPGDGGAVPKAKIDVIRAGESYVVAGGAQKRIGAKGEIEGEIFFKGSSRADCVIPSGIALNCLRSTMAWVENDSSHWRLLKVK